MSRSAVLRQVIQPVGDMASALAFYSSLLGLEAKFVDGNRYAALDAGDATVALVSPEEDVALVSAPAFKVADLDAVLAGLQASGGQLIRDVEVGPHERRAVVADPWGNRMVVYAAA